MSGCEGRINTHQRRIIEQIIKETVVDEEKTCLLPLNPSFEPTPHLVASCAASNRFGMGARILIPGPDETIAVLGQPHLYPNPSNASPHAEPTRILLPLGAPLAKAPPAPSDQELPLLPDVPTVIRGDIRGLSGIEWGQLTDSDVLYGNGGRKMKGNIRLRALVTQYLKSENAAANGTMARRIVLKIRTDGGRFLEPDGKRLFEVGDEKASRKIQCAGRWFRKSITKGPSSTTSPKAKPARVLPPVVSVANDPASSDRELPSLPDVPIVVKEETNRESGIEWGNLTPMDVLYGTGGRHTYGHPGNVRHRELVAQFLRAEHSALHRQPALHRYHLATRIVLKMRIDGGRFLEPDGLKLFEVGDQKAIKKTLNAGFRIR